MPHHPTIERYEANKLQYDLDYFLKTIDKQARRLDKEESKAILDRPEYKKLMETIVTEDDPFENIISAIYELSMEDLGWCVAYMPNEYAKRKLLERIIFLEEQGIK